MLYLFTTEMNGKFIRDIEAEFKRLKFSGETFSNDIYTKIMQRIDKVSNRYNNAITTPFGDTSLENLSTGCKAAILAAYYRNTDIGISLYECGDNALNIILQLSESLDIKAYIDRSFIPYKLDQECYINGQLVKGANNIYLRLVDACE